MNDRFDFQQFSIRQDRCAMKVGTDGVLLGAWSALPAKGRILDIGTGTGLLTLMASQRCECNIVGVEIDAAAAQQAKENVEASLWTDRIKIICSDIAQTSFDESFDCILSNPPFFSNSLPAPDKARNTARHNSALSFEALAHHARRLLLPLGTFQVVLPTGEEEAFIGACAGEKLFPEKRTQVITRPGKKPRRVLLRMSQKNSKTEEDSLLLMTESGERSEEYKRLTTNFYIR